MPRKKNVYKEPSIRLRKDGLYEARIYIGINSETKKQVVESVYGKTEKEVKEKALEFQKQKGRNQAMNVQRITLRDWLDKWLNEYKIHNIKRSSFDNYLTLINIYVIPSIGNIRLDKLGREDIHKLYSRMTEDSFSSSTVHSVHRILHSALEQAIVEGIISINPCYKIQLPKLISKEKNPLAEEEIDKLCSVLRENSYDNGILFMLNSGVRVGELLALKWADIDFESNSFSINKTIRRTSKIEVAKENDTKSELVYETPKTHNSNRVIPISEILLNILKKQQDYIETIKSLNFDTFKNTDVVFSSRNGSPIETANFNKHLESLCIKANLRKISSHVFRHTFISNAVKNKIDSRLLRRIVGHANVSITDKIYTHLDVDDLREAMGKIKQK